MRIVLIGAIAFAAECGNDGALSEPAGGLVLSEEVDVLRSGSGGDQPGCGVGDDRLLVDVPHDDPWEGAIEYTDVIVGHAGADSGASGPMTDDLVR